MLSETWQESMKDSIDGMLDGELVDFYQGVQKEALMAQAKMQYAEFCLTARMSESGASEMMGDIKDGKALKAVKTARAVEWDYSILNQLKEYFPPEQLTGIYTPEHEKAITVKEKWNMSKGKLLAKFGKDQAQIINDARIENRHKIEIKEVNFDE